MAYSQVIAVTTTAQTVTLDGSARWIEFRPLGEAAATTVTVSTHKQADGTPIVAVSEADNMQTFALDPAQVVVLPAAGAPSFSIIASASCKVAVRGVDL
jgi:hypothetical protein